MLSNIKREINKLLPKDRKAQVAYTWTKLGTQFHIKDKTKKEYQQDLTYNVKCPVDACSHNWKTGSRLSERVNEDCCKDNAN